MSSIHLCHLADTFLRTLHPTLVGGYVRLDGDSVWNRSATIGGEYLHIGDSSIPSWGYALATGGLLYYGNLNYADFSLRARIFAGAQQAGLIYRYNPATGDRYLFKHTGTTFMLVKVASNETETSLGSYVISTTGNAIFDIEIHAYANRHICYVNGVKAIDYTASSPDPLTTGRVGVFTYGNSPIFSDIVVYEANPNDEGRYWTTFNLVGHDSKMDSKIGKNDVASCMGYGARNRGGSNPITTFECQATSYNDIHKVMRTLEMFRLNARPIFINTPYEKVAGMIQSISGPTFDVRGGNKVANFSVDVQRFF